MTGRERDIAGATGRVDWVDTAKGLCIIFVVMMHSTLGVEKSAGTEGWMGLVVEFARPFRMPDFFMISACSWHWSSTGRGAAISTARSSTSPISTCSG